MKKCILVYLIIFMICIMATSNAKPPQDASLDSSTSIVNDSIPDVSPMESRIGIRGSTIAFHGKNFPDKSHISVYLDGKLSGTISSSNSTSFLYLIPKQTDLGRHILWIEFQRKSSADIIDSEPDSLTVISESGNLKPTIINVYPVTSYSNPRTKVYGFDVIGSGFSKWGPDNHLIWEKFGEKPVSWDKKREGDTSKAVRGEVVSSNHLIFTNVPNTYAGPTHISIKVGDNSSDAFAITLSNYYRWIPVTLALLIVLILISIVVAMVAGSGNTFIINGKLNRIIMPLFVDPETNTLSLAKFQVYLWTTVALISYLYFLFSRILIQNKGDFPDIPAGLPGIILISASTSFLAVGITSVKGTKGAGDIHPSWGDLVTSGGVIAPERIQFFIWTIVGAISFLSIVILQAPENINALPIVPTGFLSLMGFSSVGYLGGKIARKPGPVIDSIVATPGQNGNLNLIVKGQKLSQDAAIQINDEVVTSTIIQSNVIDGLPADRFSKELSVVISTPKPDWLKTAKLTIFNPDNQMASWTYNDEPLITSINPLSVSLNVDAPIQLKGSGFDSTCVIAISPQGKTTTKPTVTFDSINVSVQMSGTSPYAATLTVTNPNGKTASITFQVT